MKYGKIISGELVLVDPTKAELTEEGIYTRVPKTAEELDGAKPVVYGEYPSATIYQTVDRVYNDGAENIAVDYTVTDKTAEEVAEIDRSIWASDAIQIFVSAELGEEVPEEQYEVAVEEIIKQQRNKLTSPPVQGAAYSETKNYITGDTMLFTDGNTYMSLKHNRGMSPIDYPERWLNTTVQGNPNWEDDPIDFYYLEGDIRDYEGLTYTCKNPHSKNELNYPTSQNGKQNWRVQV